MSRFSEDDVQLTRFLQQHQPGVPAAAPGLEDQVMAAIAATPIAQISSQPQSTQSQWVGFLTIFSTVRLHRQFLWVVPSAIAAGLVAMVVNQRTFTPAAQPSPVEVAELQAFIESTWHGSVTEQSESEDDLSSLPNDPSLN
jgi:hypothetical protein